MTSVRLRLGVTPPPLPGWARLLLGSCPVWSQCAVRLAATNINTHRSADAEQDSQQSRQ